METPVGLQLLATHSISKPTPEPMEANCGRAMERPQGRSWFRIFAAEPAVVAPTNLCWWTTRYISQPPKELTDTNCGLWIQPTSPSSTIPVRQAVPAVAQTAALRVPRPLLMRTTRCLLDITTPALFLTTAT